MRRYKLCLIVILLIFSFFGNLNYAKATHVKCGDVVNQSTTLDSDLAQTNTINCITISHPFLQSITFDCAGHSIKGNSSINPAIAGSGIQSLQAVDHRIINCNISSFKTGIWISPKNFVENNIIDAGSYQKIDNTIGIKVSSSLYKFENIRILRNKIKGSNWGIYDNSGDAYGSNNTVSFNVVEDTTTGIRFFQITGTNVENNTINITDTGIRGFIMLDSNITSNKIVNASGQFSTGISVESSTNLNIVKNIVKGFPTGISFIGTSNNIIQGNTVAEGGVGIILDGTGTAFFKENYVLSNHDSMGGLSIRGPIEVKNNIICANTPFDIVNDSDGGFGNNNVCGPVFTWNETGASNGCIYKCGNLSGFVTDGHKYSEEDPGHPSAANLHPLKKVKVTMQLPNVNISAFTSNAGNYFFYAPYDPTGSTAPVNATIRIDLVDEEDIVKIFDWQGDQNNPTNFRTNKFQINTTQITKDINAMQTVDLDPLGHNSNNINKLDDISLLYFHTKEATDFTKEILGLTMNYELPVEIYSYRPAGTGVFYCRNSTSGSCGFNSFITKINIDTTNSPFNDDDVATNRDWHEFSHHIMADSLIGGDNNSPPRDGVNHGLFENPTSADSWSEGFAEYIPLIIADKNSYTNPSRYYWSGGTQVVGGRAYDNLELNYKLRQDEEFAITGILWDLYDGVDNARDNDTIQLGIKQIWDILNNVNNRNNIYDIYIAFNNSGIALLTQDTDLDGISNLDELFIVRDAYNDTDNSTTYNLTEPVGFTTWKNKNGVTRPNRHDKPFRDGSFLNLTVIDFYGNKVENATLNIQEVNPSPYEIYNHNYSVNMTGLPGLIYFSMLPTPSIDTLTASKDNFTSDPLKINSDFYWDNLGKNYILNHTFKLLPNERIDLQIKNLYVANLSNLTVNGKVIIAFDLINNGSLTANNVTLLIDKNSTLENNINFTIPIINPGQRLEMFFNWNYSQQGNYKIKVIADFNNQIFETNELNNQKTLNINILPSSASTTAISKQIKTNPNIKSREE